MKSGAFSKYLFEERFVNERGWGPMIAISIRSQCQRAMEKVNVSTGVRRHYDAAVRRISDINTTISQHAQCRYGLLANSREIQRISARKSFLNSLSHYVCFYAPWTRVERKRSLRSCNYREWNNSTFVNAKNNPYYL